MRIVGGEFGGRALSAPRSLSIRPTTDRARETLFNMLGARLQLDGLRVIDCFAGTGALGLEALSRGAAFVLFVEGSAEGTRLIRSNIEAFGVDDRTQVLRKRIQYLGDCNAAQPFDLVFADPPYGKGLGEDAARVLARGNWLRKGALFVLEEAPDSPPAAMTGFEHIQTRRVGQSQFTFFEYRGTPEGPGNHAKMTKD